MKFMYHTYIKLCLETIFSNCAPKKGDILQCSGNIDDCCPEPSNIRFRPFLPQSLLGINGARPIKVDAY